MRRHIPMICVLAIGSNVAEAQQITVQQPVVEQFGVGTTVSVPDRGSALLGGVGSAASGRITTGPFRSGSSVGLSRQASSARVHVFIHDFEAMDAALLHEPVSVASSRIEPRILSRLSRGDPRIEVDQDDRPRTGVVWEAEQLARQAEARGKPGVAKLHWQRAARHGSKVAAEKLAENAPSAKRR
jgi:hypothetical protein